MQIATIIAVSVLVAFISGGVVWTIWGVAENVFGVLANRRSSESEESAVEDDTADVKR